VISYNLHGWNQGQPLLTDLCHLNKASVIFLQETWLTPDNMSKVLNLSCNYTSFSVSAMENVLGQLVLKGRLFGGVSILVQKRLVPYVICLEIEARYMYY